MNKLPIDGILPTLCAALDNSANVVLQAPPGAGKTTRVPLALLDAPWRRGGKIIMLEPRRLAARAAARRMALTLGEAVGKTVGYRVQLDSQVGPDTLIEVVTEGILTRRLQRDPSLEGVAAVIFDEFHERNLQADLGLALCLDGQAGLREDLRLLVMSATLDGAPVAALMGDAAVVSSEGRAYHVATHYLGKPAVSRFRDTFCPAVVAAIQRAIKEETGSILVFLPGEGEIRRVGALLKDYPLPVHVSVLPLYGALPQSQQDQAIAPTRADQRKIVLATAIAETSLTIEGIRVVIDGGLSREPRFDPQSGMTRLVTDAVSLAGATQRQGRAGRVAPGICYRLWDKAGEGALRTFRQPEILNADLAPLALDLASWGISDAGALNWLTPPPEAPLAQARDLLRLLDALDGQGRITAHGRAMAELAMHPRLAHMVIRGADMGWADTACKVAAVLSERDIAERDGHNPVPADLNLRLSALNGDATPLQINRNGLSRIRTLARLWRKRLPKQADPDHGLDLSGDDQTGALVALAYPDRIARRRAGGDARYLQSNGKGAALPAEDALADAPYLAISLLTDDMRDARIRLASRITASTIEYLFENQIIEKETAVWDSQNQAVLARRQKCLQALVLHDAPAKTIPPEQIANALIGGIREMGLDCLPWSKDAIDWRQRVRCLYQGTGSGADLSDEALMQNLEDWLQPYLSGKSRLSHLKSLDMAGILKAMMDWAAQQALEKQVPSHFTVPSGSSIRIDYSDPAAPVLPVKLQEMFGSTETPSLLDGRLALTIHLLSPAGRTLQITQDLPAFWNNAYPQVKAEMRGRYPKHPWPDDPVAATATRHAKSRMGKTRERK
ncbi:MAG: ATP-dependent helicase HrpB [Rhodospirillales bacterium]|nr:ATP-dependent helicase HrpB [Rhodospirillales bacterium]